MIARCVSPVLVAMVALVCALSIAIGPAKADLFPPIDACAILAPDKTLSLQINGGVQQVSSVTTDYAARSACPRFIVDIWVPSVPVGTYASVTFEGVVDTSLCTGGVGANLWLYKKPLGSSSFQFATTGSPGGPNGCLQKTVGTSTSVGQGWFGGVTWRVEVAAHLNTIFGLLPSPVIAKAVAST
jgi:hypothetical protein